MMERVDLVAPTDAPVLILGETGSGKEVVARTIHDRSRREAGPFLRVNCGAIPTELVDSELFGHERGSFTGAIGDRKGWFERADGGTLFLDECGELPPAAQVRLLRILQDGTFERVGGERLGHGRRAGDCGHAPRFAGHGGRRAGFARICGIAWPCFRSACRRCATGWKIFPSMAAHFALRSAKRNGVSPVLPTGRRPEPAGRLSLAGQRPRAGRRNRTGRDPGRRQAPGGGQGTGRCARGPRSRRAPQSGMPTAGRRFPTLDEAMARHIEAALVRTRGGSKGPPGRPNCWASIRTRCGPACASSSLDWNRFRSN